MLFGINNKPRETYWKNNYIKASQVQVRIAAEGRVGHRWGAPVSQAIDLSVTTSLKSTETRALLRLKSHKLPQFF